MVIDQQKEIRLYLAPMMKRTDRHFRYLVRLISPSIHLFTEMIPAELILHGNREHALEFSKLEEPIAIQLGSSNPDLLSKAAEVSTYWGYNEVNLNCGCPSSRVLKGKFGAHLMRDPVLAANCINAMRTNTPPDIPISAKIRLGIDELYSYEYLSDFVGRLIDAGATIIQVHARKALVKLNPKRNRNIPPINYDWAYHLKREYRDILVILNGEINNVDSAKLHLRKLDGIMIGRLAYAQPLQLNHFDQSLFPKSTAPNRTVADILEKYFEYVDNELTKGTSLRQLLQHLFNIFHGQPQAKRWRKFLTESIVDKNMTVVKLQTETNKIIERLLNNLKDCPL